MDLQTLIQAALPTLSKTVGRDLSIELKLFYRARAAVGNSVNEHGQKFVMENWRKLPDFLETPAGQAALSELIIKWANASNPAAGMAPASAPPIP